MLVTKIGRIVASRIVYHPTLQTTTCVFYGAYVHTTFVAGCFENDQIDDPIMPSPHDKVVPNAGVGGMVLSSIDNSPEASYQLENRGDNLHRLG